MTNPSETKLVETLKARALYMTAGVMTSERDANDALLMAQASTALASLADELRLAREEQIALLRFIQKEHPVTPEMWKAMFNVSMKEPR